MSRKNRNDSEKSKNWEHSRYRDWRPSYREDEHARRPARYYEPRRRRSFLGWLFRVVIALAVIVLLFGPGLDYVNGRSKAAEGACAVRVVVDGDSVMPGCPDGRQLPGEIAGYDAPELLRPGCFAEFQAALMAGLEIRKALFSADEVTLRAAGAVPAPDIAPQPDAAAAEGDEPETPGADTPESETPGAEAPEPAPPAEDPLAVPESDPPALSVGETPVVAGEDGGTAPDAEPPAAGDPVATGGALRVMVDGRDLAEVMLASETVQPTGGPGWCE